MSRRLGIKTRPVSRIRATPAEMSNRAWLAGGKNGSKKLVPPYTGLDVNSVINMHHRAGAEVPQPQPEAKKHRCWAEEKLEGYAVRGSPSLQENATPC